MGSLILLGLSSVICEYLLILEYVQFVNDPYKVNVMLVINTEIGKKAWLFAKLQPGRARKRMNAT